MRWLLLPIFLLRLLLVITPTLVEIILGSFVSFSLLAVIGLFTWHAIALVYYTTVPVTPLLPTPIPANHTSLFNHLKQTTAVQLITEPDLAAQHTYWENLYQLQPTHRDVLVNLALLELYRDNQLGYQTYWEQARHTDPNHPLFK